MQEKKKNDTCYNDYVEKRRPSKVYAFGIQLLGVVSF